MALLKIDNVKFREVFKSKELMKYMHIFMMQLPKAINALLGWHKNNDMVTIIECGEVYVQVAPLGSFGAPKRLHGCTGGWVDVLVDGCTGGWMDGSDGWTDGWMNKSFMSP